MELTQYPCPESSPTANIQKPKVRSLQPTGLPPPGLSALGWDGAIPPLLQNGCGGLKREYRASKAL